MEAPRSIAIIMDGNRRFAKKLLKQPYEGHKLGREKAREFLEWAKDANIKCVTFYTLSIENMEKRPEIELNKLYEYLNEELDNLLKEDHRVHETKTRIKFIGRRELLPEDMQKKMAEIEEKTGSYDQHFLNMAIAYGSQQEITDTCKKICKQVKEGSLDPEQIDEGLFSKNMYLEESEYPELVIRTGNVKRISNFLLWQAAYSELAFTEELWPELKKETFLKIIEDYKNRERRFGK